MRQCDDGILVFDVTRNLTHLIADEAWDLYCRLREAGVSSAKGEVSLSSGVYTHCANDEEGEMIEVLETAGLIRRC